MFDIQEKEGLIVVSVKDGKQLLRLQSDGTVEKSVSVDEVKDEIKEHFRQVLMISPKMWQAIFTLRDIRVNEKHVKKLFTMDLSRTILSELFELERAEYLWIKYLANDKNLIEFLIRELEKDELQIFLHYLNKEM